MSGEEGRVHPTCVMGQDVILAPDVSLGAFVVLEDGVQIGAATLLESSVFVGRGAHIGARCTLEAGVVVREGVRLGDDCIVRSGAVIGTDGFGFVEDGGVHHKIPQVGTVEVESGSVIGPGACIDRATTGVTRIGAGTVLGALVQIGHNCDVGRDVIIGPLAGVAGSARIGDHVRMGAGAGVGPHYAVGDGTRLEDRTGVVKDVPAGAHLIGFPSRTLGEFEAVQALLDASRTLPQRVDALEASMSRLETSS